jgi:hypothetical protein
MRRHFRTAYNPATRTSEQRSLLVALAENMSRDISLLLLCVTSSRCLPAAALENAVVTTPAAWCADRCLATRKNIRNSLVACVYSVTGGVT